jgi:hypothetical protein
MYDKWHKDRRVKALREQGQAGLAAIGVYSVFHSACLDDPCLDGFIPMSDLRHRGEKLAARMLLSAGLWQEAPEGYPEGYVMVDLDLLPTRDQIERKRYADRIRKAEKNGIAPPRVAYESHASRARLAPPDLDQDQKKRSDPLPPAVVIEAPSREYAYAREAREGGKECSVSEETAQEAPEEALGTLVATAAAAGSVGGRQRGAGASSGPRTRLDPAPVWRSDLEVILRDLKPGNMVLGDRPPPDSGRVPPRGVDAPGEAGEPSDDAEESAELAPGAPGSGVHRMAHIDPLRFAGDCWAAFRRLYHEQFHRLPYMNASNAGDFPERVMAMAQHLEEDPFRLFERAFRAWVADPPKEKIGRQCPYANFVLRFDALVEVSEGRAKVSPKSALEAQINKALEAGDFPTYERLNRAYLEQYPAGGSRRARPAG